MRLGAKGLSDLAEWFAKPFGATYCNPCCSSWSIFWGRCLQVRLILFFASRVRCSVFSPVAVFVIFFLDFCHVYARFFSFVSVSFGGMCVFALVIMLLALSRFFFFSHLAVGCDSLIANSAYSFCLSFLGSAVFRLILLFSGLCFILLCMFTFSRRTDCRL